MKKREHGILTVEASLVMGVLVLVVLFIFSFARLYRAQSVVSHAVLQASDAVAMESYLRETAFDGDATEIAQLANKIDTVTTVNGDSFTSLRSANLPQIAKEKFILALSDTESGAEKALNAVGIKGGINGIDFGRSIMDLDNNDVIIYADYTIKLQFPVFGFKELKVSKAAKAKTFGEILFEIQTLSENNNKGSATGGGNYKHGSKIQISATPNYGYKFSSWQDGNTDNPRTVTVSGAATYIAKFTEDNFGVTVVSNPVGAGNPSGSGEYAYLTNATIAANPNPGYSFEKWIVYSDKDKKSNTYYDAQTTLDINQRYYCTAYYKLNDYKVSVISEGAGDANGATVSNSSQNGKAITAPYTSSFQLYAADIYGYKFLGWKEQGKGNYITTSRTVNLTVPPRDVTYIACYETLLRTVVFKNYNGSVYATRTVYAGNSLGGNMPQNPFYAGYRFNGWANFNSGTIVYNNIEVAGNWSYCKSHKWGHCGVKHYFSGKAYWYITDIHKNSEHWVYWASCTRCVYCKKQGTYRVLCGTHWEINGAKGWYGYDYVGPNDCGSYNLP